MGGRANTSANELPSLLEKIECPNDLRSLSLEELERLCEELRQYLIRTVGNIGGHFASSLGVVELTVACHRVFNTPHDRLVWDVGHQAYVHKILTGRRLELHQIRHLGGISGFPRRTESKYDTFGVGHAGTSISAATGMLEALQHSDDPGKVDSKVIAIIGDGAMTSGMAFEALNHSGHLHKNLVVILNDNEMSIAPNVGALSLAFSSTLNSQLGTSARRHFRSLVERGLIPEVFYKSLYKLEDAAQGFLSTPAMLFEAFGYRYIGPLDGHNLDQLLGALEKAKNQDGPVLVHTITVKGKGFAPAEADPVKYHGVDAFKKVVATKAPVPPPTYTAVFGKTVIELCKKDKRIVAITAAMPDGTGLTQLATEMPDRFYDVGIAEQHAVTFAAGLACEGMKPICAIYSTFLQRAFDQILHDVCIQQLPVIFALDRGGLVGADGATHHGVFDLSYLRSMPNITILSPADEGELRDMLYAATSHNGPIAIRYPRGHGVGVDLSQPPRPLEIGKGEVFHRPKKHTPKNNHRVLILALGPVVHRCVEAATELEELHGIEITVANCRSVKPLDEDLLFELISDHLQIVTVEDNSIVGGFGGAVLEFMSESNLLANRQLMRLGVPDIFIEHGTQDQLYRICGFDTKGIVESILDRFNLTKGNAAVFQRNM